MVLDATTPQQGEAESTVVVPGDKIKSIAALSASGVVQIGSGLTQKGDSVTAVQSGVVHWMTRNQGQGTRAWVDCNQKRYNPCVEDMVIGIVQNKQADEYRLDIRSARSENDGYRLRLRRTVYLLVQPCPAILPALAFEGATKRSRPYLQIGNLVYCRVSLAIKDCEPELTCTSLTNKKGWMTGQAVFGELEGGHMFEVAVGYARTLLHPDCPVVSILGKHIPYEIAVGANGRVWVKCGNVKHTILVVNTIMNSEFLLPGQIEEMVKTLIDYHSKEQD